MHVSPHDPILGGYPSYFYISLGLSLLFLTF